MLNTSNSVAAVTPPSHGETIATLGRRDRDHLRVIGINSLERYIVVAVHAGEMLHSSCYLHANERQGYNLEHSVRHCSPAPAMNLQATVRALLSDKRFNSLLGIGPARGPIDVLRCGVAVGGCTFLMREFPDSEFVAVFDDGDRQTQWRASADDWNALTDAWEAEDANYGDGRRVRIAERFFRARGWMPPGVGIFGNESAGDH